MLCPKCGGVTKVCDTRYEDKENEIFRRRACKQCANEFFTVEFDVETNAKFDMLWKRLKRGAMKLSGGHDSDE